MAKKIAVIGAGASGLTAIKCCLDEGLQPICFERTENIGGLWRYSDDVEDGQPSVMKSTIINTSKEMMCYSDFPIPKEYPIYMHNTYVYKYFNLYAEKFDLIKHVRFKTEVLHIRQKSDFNQSGQWDLKIRDKTTGKEEDLVFDAVMVCTGHHADKHVPEFPGLAEFQGKVIHSHDYKHSKGYEDKNILIVGIGNSGGDAAVELARTAKQVYLSTRRGSWVLNRIGDGGMPSDMNLTTRMNTFILGILPHSIVNGIAERQLNKRFDHAAYSLKPKHPVFSQHPMVNDDLPNRIASGTVVIKPDVKCFTKTGVEFVDGTHVDDLDIVFLATGYKFGFPFIDKSVIDVKENKCDLYKYTFPPELSKPTLSVIGYVQPIGALMPISELQCRLSTRIFKGDVVLPPKEEMQKDIANKRVAMAMRYTQSQRHTIQVDWIPFMDELAELNGCKPDIKGLFLSDPKLALKCFLGPCTPYQFRLVGPGKWEGARDAILTVWDRTLFALKSRPLGFNEEPSQLSPPVRSTEGLMSYPKCECEHQHPMLKFLVKVFSCLLTRCAGRLCFLLTALVCFTFCILVKSLV